MSSDSKVSSQDSFYLRNLRTNLFWIYAANEDIMNCFFHDESTSGSRPNEVLSLLNYVLETLIERYGTFHHLILWADNSPAQFKHLDTLVRNGRFLQVDLKFRWKGICIQYVIEDLGVFCNSLTLRKKLKFHKNGQLL